jgi:hypothetical protein
MVMPDELPEPPPGGGGGGGVVPEFVLVQEYVKTHRRQANEMFRRMISVLSFEGKYHSCDK